MHTRTAACTALLIAAAATACTSSGSNTPDDKAPAATASAKPTPSAPAKALAFGTGHHWSDTDADGSHISGTTTVMGYTQPAKDVSLTDGISNIPNPDWAVLDVKVCAAADSTTVMVAQQPWNLGYADDTRLAAPNISGSGVAEPAYSVDGAAVKAGTCYRGKITFYVKHGTRPTQIIYAVDQRDPVEWAVPAA
jgi:hypothetical protein